MAILTLFSTISVFAFNSDTILENGSFELEPMLWQNGHIVTESPYSGANCLAFSCPTILDSGIIYHTLSYLSTISLTANTVYALKLYIKTDIPESTQLTPEGEMSISTTQGAFTMRVSNVNETWHPVVVCFTSDTTGTYSFSISIESSFENATFYIDDISISTIDFKPVELSIQGNRSITIPEIGEVKSKYTAVVSDGLGHYIDNRNATLTPILPLPNGVHYDTEKNELIVSADAEDSEVTLICSPLNNSASFVPVSASIYISRNLIINGNFQDIPIYNGWEQSSVFSIIESDSTNLCAKLSFSPENNIVSFSPTPSFLLSPDVMYVFRANVRSEHNLSNIQPTAESEILETENNIKINISNIPSADWIEVFCAFYVPTYGTYTLQINIEDDSSAAIYIDEIKLQPEESKPAGVLLDLPQHFNIPDSDEIIYKINHFVYDQEGKFFDTNIQFEIFPEDSGVFIEDNLLIISSDALPENYTLSAFSENNAAVLKKQKIEITHETVADGSFESDLASLHWKTASPSTLDFITEYNSTYPSHGEKMAFLSMYGSVSALLSDSIYKYEAGNSYVFNVNMMSTIPSAETIITVLIDNASSDSFDDNVVVGQFTVSDSMQHIQKLFTPSVSVVGRLMIAVNTDSTFNEQSVLLDDVKISEAQVSVSGVSISGTPFVDRNIVGSYRFSSNFPAVNSSTFRWLFSNEPNGIFMPMDGRIDTVLSITADMVGKYVKFEVTPISLNGPVVGAIATSAPILIGSIAPSQSADFTTDENSILPPQENTDVKASGGTEGSTEADKIISIDGMQFLDIRKFKAPSSTSFWDTEKHWAKNEIEILSSAGIVRGRGNGLFEPDVYITRAEFTAFLAPAFMLAPIYYEGQFEDVKYYNWYAGAIAVVTKHGIAQGTGEKTFSPELPITREEMAAMIMRAYRKTGAQVINSNLQFTDISNVSHWALQNVSEAYGLGLLSGMPDGSFQPKKNATRAEAAVVLKRMLDVLANRSS